MLLCLKFTADRIVCKAVPQCCTGSTIKTVSRHLLFFLVKICCNNGILKVDFPINVCPINRPGEGSKLHTAIKHQTRVSVATSQEKKKTLHHHMSSVSCRGSGTQSTASAAALI